MPGKNKLVKIKSRFDYYYGDISTFEREIIIWMLRLFMSEIRKFYCDASDKLDRCLPDREKSCHSCAFNPECDSWKGFVYTAYGLLWAINNRSPFLCHRNQPLWKDHIIDRTQLTACLSYVSVRALHPKEMYEIAKITMDAITEFKAPQ